jgi:hypothetical protein
MRKIKGAPLTSDLAGENDVPDANGFEKRSLAHDVSVRYHSGRG